jgi:hypothetical protein
MYPLETNCVNLQGLIWARVLLTTEEQSLLQVPITVSWDVASVAPARHMAVQIIMVFFPTWRSRGLSRKLEQTHYYSRGQW